MYGKAEPFLWAGGCGAIYLGIAGSAGPWWITTLEWALSLGLLTIGIAKLRAV